MKRVTGLRLKEGVEVVDQIDLLRLNDLASAMEAWIREVIETGRIGPHGYADTQVFEDEGRAILARIDGEQP